MLRKAALLTLVLILLLLSPGCWLRKRPPLRVVRYWPTGQVLALDAIGIEFERPVDKNSLAGAFSISPHLPGEMAFTEKGFQFYPAEEPVLGQTYQVSITEDLRGREGERLPGGFTWKFTLIEEPPPARAEPPRVLEVGFFDGPTALGSFAQPGRYPVERFNRVKIQFDQPMLRPRVEEAVHFGELDPASGARLSLRGHFQWRGSSILSFQPVDTLEVGKTYFLSIDTRASSLAGLNLPVENEYILEVTAESWTHLWELDTASKEAHYRARLPVKGEVEDLALSPDGSTLAVLSREPHSDYLPHTLWLVDLASATVKSIPDIQIWTEMNLVTNLWSPGGDRLVFSAFDGETSLIEGLRRADGGLEAYASSGNLGQKFLVSPALSPDGKRLAFLGLDFQIDRTEVRVYAGPVGGSFQQPVAVLSFPVSIASEYTYMAGAVWTPDGKRIIVDVNLGEPASGIWEVPTTGGQPLKIIERGVGPLLEPSGERMGYWVDGTFWITNLDGSGPREIGSRDWVRARWAPDGEQILFGRSGDRGLALVTLSSGEVRELTDFPARAADWDPAGDKIYFVSSRRGKIP